MSLKYYELNPRDLLFFRDARPMDLDKSEAAHRNVGHGAVWPRPDHLYNAVMHALIGSRSCGEAEYGKHGGVMVVGPYPLQEGRLLFPRPLDWDMQIEPCRGTDLPDCLSMGFIDRVEGKKDYPAWIGADEYGRYLSGKVGAGKSADELDSPKDGGAPLFYTEPRVSTTIDAASEATVRIAGKRSGQYQAEYLRLAQGVSLWCGIDCGEHGDPARVEAFILGGQCGIVNASAASQGLEAVFPAPTAAPAGDGRFYVKWTLIAPAYFERTGWLPGWCENSDRGLSADERRRSRGQVMFPDTAGVRLVGACTGKPFWFSGWDTLTGVKPTRLAVPAGSAYLFACPSQERAQALMGRLHLRRQSDFGPQGFGIGVCSSVLNINFNS